MRKIFLSLIFTILLSFSMVFAVETYSENNKFGLIDNDEKITEAKYSKLIRLGDSSYIFMYKSKFGIMDNQGNIIVEPKFTSAERFVGRFAKLGSKGKYALFDEQGIAIVPLEYSSINLLYGKMFLVGKNYKYGLINFEGDILLAPVADDIYMPEANILKISFDNNWYEIQHVGKETMELPKDLVLDNKSNDFKITKIVEQPITTTGYGIVSASDYFIKVFSSISPAYEKTIDELILSHGADTALILLNPMWIVKFPYTYIRNYANSFKTPNNGPLADVKASLKNKLN